MRPQPPSALDYGYAVFAPEDVCCVIEPVGDTAQPLLEAERQMLGRGAVARRVAEFAAGRHCARLALRELGIEAGPIPIGERGAPQWPAGVTGSISHGAELAGAVAARTTAYSGLGLDIERRGRLAPQLYRLLFTEQELAAPITPDLAVLLFSAKEAVYKAAFPLLRQWIDFTEVLIEVDTENCRFRVRPVAREAELALLGAGAGRFAFRGEAVLTLFHLPP
jgi:4'-phosphopantetheinyl transferase EntD